MSKQSGRHRDLLSEKKEIKSRIIRNILIIIKIINIINYLNGYDKKSYDTRKDDLSEKLKPAAHSGHSIAAPQPPPCPSCSLEYI
jgi:hypothetical protein